MTTPYVHRMSIFLSRPRSRSVLALIVCIHVAYAYLMAWILGFTQNYYESRAFQLERFLLRGLRSEVLSFFVFVVVLTVILYSLIEVGQRISGRSLPAWAASGVALLVSPAFWYATYHMCWHRSYRFDPVIYWIETIAVLGLALLVGRRTRPVSLFVVLPLAAVHFGFWYAAFAESAWEPFSLCIPFFGASVYILASLHNHKARNNGSKSATPDVTSLKIEDH